MSYEDNYDQTARWDAESVREAEQRTQHRSTRSSAERQKLKKKGQRRRFTLWLAFVLITSAILAGVGWLLANDMCSFNKAPVETTIEITRDDNLNTIATKLHDEGLIKYKWFFKAFGRLRHAESRIGIGTYAVDSDMDYDALINRMSNKNASLTANTVKISIPEGYNVRQIIALMDKYGVNTAEKLTDAAMNSDFNYSFIDNNKKGDLTRLEGYLFPDTYEFFVDEDPTHALSRLLDNFNTKMSDELMQKVEASGYSLNQILTIASLIEKETDGTDRENIASVIYNRLNNIGETYHKLQIDASLIYGLGDNYTGTLTSSDLNYNTPYNLSMYEGGIDCIKIEGRAKSAYYAAIVTGAYRHVLDDVAAGREVDPVWRDEVEHVSHRHYSTGFYYGQPGQYYDNSRYIRDWQVCAVVTDCDADGNATLSLRNKFAAGDEIELVGPDSRPFTMTAPVMHDLEGFELYEPRTPQTVFKMKLPRYVPPMSFVRHAVSLSAKD